MLRDANAHVNVSCFVAQNLPNSDWEKKVTDYFKEKLKENNATNWVRFFFVILLELWNLGIVFFLSLNYSGDLFLRSSSFS